MNDKKAAKRIIKLAKKHPDWYTKEDVKFAKKVKKRIKQQEENARLVEDQSE
mgnify:FL=1|jgi:hypothetical protein|tara:strand:- start:383 stop:538 length:156 start_codon:yes stop_codon:yes gene_type:complete